MFDVCSKLDKGMNSQEIKDLMAIITHADRIHQRDEMSGLASNFKKLKLGYGSSNISAGKLINEFNMGKEKFK